MNKLTSERSKLFTAIFEAIRHHQMSNMMMDDGEGFYPLVDLMTRDGMDIGDGIDQMQTLSWAIEEAVGKLPLAIDGNRIKTTEDPIIEQVRQYVRKHRCHDVDGFVVFWVINAYLALATHPTSQTPKED